MNISDSPLFRDFARPVLQPDARSKKKAHPPSSIMDSILLYLVNGAKLDVSCIRIADATEDSFSLSIESRITGTGPVSCTISPMILDLTFNGFTFGKVGLPEIRTSFWGSKVSVEKQTIKITDMAIYRAFLRSIIVDDDTNFQLENGACTIQALGLTAHCNYNLDIPVAAMKGPRITLRQLSRSDDDGITVMFRVDNPSPLELDHGDICTFELHNSHGEWIAKLKGELKMVRAQFEFTLHGVVRNGVAPSDKVRLIGVGVESRSWCNETIQHIDATMDMSPEFAALLR